MRVLLAIVALFLAAGLAELRAETPKRELPAPTGKYSIGRVPHYWTDEARGEPPAARELRVDVWYPAEPAAGATKAPYCSDLAALRKAIGAESFLWGSLSTHAVADAPIAAGTSRYPIVLFTPGHGMNACQYTALIEELVSHGYVVAGVDHPSQSKAIVYADGRVAGVVEGDKAIYSDPKKSLQNYRDRVELRSADLQHVLNRLNALDAGQDDSRFAGRLDLARVGVLGHSLGGVAAAEACHDDPRIKAAVNMDGHANSLPFLLDEEGRGPQKPFLELTDAATPPTDKQLAQWKVSRDEFEQQSAAQAQRVASLMRAIDGGSYRVSIAGTRHQSFGDAAIWDPGTPQERVRRIQIMRDYVRAFFDKFLLDNEKTLLDETTGESDMVTVERFQPDG